MESNGLKSQWTLVTRLIARPECLKIACAILFAAFAFPAHPQTYKVGSDATAKPEAQSGQTQGAGQQLGWGSNIQNARLARAAELALQRGDHALAREYAARAAQSAPNDAQLWFLLGYAARLDGKYGQSADAYRQGLRLQPASLNGLSGLAQTYSMTGQSNEAERLLKQVLASDPNQTDDLLLLANLQMRSGDYTDALDPLSKAEHVAPGARQELLLAISYEHLKQMDQANHYLQLAKTRAPNNPDVERSLAGYYRDTGDDGKAIEELKAIRNPAPDVVAELAYTYSLNGDLKQAADTYAHAADAMPRDVGLQLSAAQAQVAANAIDQANPFLERAAKLDPNYYRLHAIRAEIAQTQDHDEDAVREYSEAVANLPAAPVEGPLYGIQLHMDLQALYENLSESDLAQKQLQIARAQIGGLNEQGSDRAAFLRLRAQIEMNSGEEDAALNDMNASLALNAHDPNSLQLDGDVLMKLGRTNDAIAIYGKILATDPRNRYALTSMGYASRAAGDDQDAEKYFEALLRDYPSLYVPYLALGDIYTAGHEYKKAQVYYERGYAVAPKNALIVAGGMNAAIEGHDLTLADTWLHRVSDNMETTPLLLAQEERYFYFKGDTQRSAQLGEEAIKDLPRDRDVVVYLGYDLLNEEKYGELSDLTKKYMNILAKEPDIPLLAGYVYKHDGEQEQAEQAFTEALNRDPTVATAYVNRGFVRNDLRDPAEAASDFEQAIEREPKNGQAHLGLAFSDLALNRNDEAVRQSQLSEDELGDSKLYHTIRATAYGREGLLTKAGTEYKAALKFTPDDGTLYMGLGNVYFAERRYHDAVAQLDTAEKYLPDNAAIYALAARAYAGLDDRQQTMRNVQLAEEYASRMPATEDDPSTGAGSPISDIYISTGEALSTLGDQNGAMERFSRALVVPHANRVGVRLAVAQLMAQQGHDADAQRQIALAQMEADAHMTPPISGEQYIAAASVLEQMHEYQLSETYLERAKAAGASDIEVRVSLANDYLALGDTTRAAAELAAVSQSDGSRQDYQYLLAEANVYEQEHRGTQALSAFAQAASATGEDQTAEQAMLNAGASEGYEITPQLSVLSNLLVHSIFEDSTVYVLDSKLFSSTGPVPPSDAAQLPPPRSSIETNWTTAYHLHLGMLPNAGGFFELRNARGQISVPALHSIVNRDTTDTSFNFGVAPSIRVGSNVVTVNSGVQETIRRDSLSPVQMDQNLFRVFTYVTTSSFCNAVSADGYFIRESGPFTEAPISSQTLTGAFDFRVGAPWGRTALVTGWGRTDQQFPSQVLGFSENYFTSSYIGLSRRFSTHLNVQAIAEDLRSWRIVPFSPLHSAISQALRPAATLEYSPSRNWAIEATSAYDDTRGFHIYDMTENGLSVSYMRPLGRTYNEETGEVHLKFPIRFSGGIQEETFPNFTHGANQQFRPYVSINLF